MEQPTQLADLQLAVVEMLKKLIARSESGQIMFDSANKHAETYEKFPEGGWRRFDTTGRIMVSISYWDNAKCSE